MFDDVILEADESLFFPQFIYYTKLKFRCNKIIVSYEGDLVIFTQMGHIKD